MFAFMTVLSLLTSALLLVTKKWISKWMQVVMLLTMLAYFRLRDEGMEDNMTINGDSHGLPPDVKDVAILVLVQFSQLTANV